MICVVQTYLRKIGYSKVGAKHPQKDPCSPSGSSTPGSQHYILWIF